MDTKVDENRNNFLNISRKVESLMQLKFELGRMSMPRN